MEYKLRISQWPANERPRERLFKYGSESLSDAELLAILLRTGKHGKSSVDLARELLVDGGGLRGLDARSASQLCQFHGIGLAKAAQIKAAVELGKRLQQERSPDREYFRTSTEVFDFMHLRLCNQPREQFFVLLLTARNKLIAEKKVFEGSLRESIVNPREIVKLAVNEQAAGVVFVHNHPSGEPSPSPDDLKITKKLQSACETVDINVLDHLIIGGDKYFSFADEGLL